MRKDEVSLQRFLVLGAARSGIAAARLLKKHLADVIVADSKPAGQARDTIAELDAFGIPSVWGDSNIRPIIPQCNFLVKSPGIPQDHPLVRYAAESMLRIISEVELAYAFVPDGVRVIAVTGTNGKTTTTAWLAHVLATCGFNAVPAGNIGDAWCAQLVEQEPFNIDRLVYVVEVSSFQLENLEDFHPDVAVLTNISPDHMDRYDNRMDLYVAAKANILRNMSGDDIFIWNCSDAASRPVADAAVCCRMAYTPGPANEALSAWVQDGQLFARTANVSIPVVAAEDLPLPGRHNLENALCTLLAALAVGADPEDVRRGLMSFPGVEHRIELCGTRADGIRFYNDSKATNLDAMEKAVKAFKQPIVLIGGGRDAHSDYASINHLVKEHVVHLITLGEAANLIEDAWGKLVPTSRAGTMAEAVKLANDVAEPGSVVVFSPACKSFDMYANFEERGRDFKHHVQRVVGQQ